MKTVYDPGLVHYDVTGGLWFWFDLLQMDYKNAKKNTGRHWERELQHWWHHMGKWNCGLCGVQRSMQIICHTFLFVIKSVSSQSYALSTQTISQPKDTRGLMSFPLRHPDIHIWLITCVNEIPIALQVLPVNYSLEGNLMFLTVLSHGLMCWIVTHHRFKWNKTFLWIVPRKTKQNMSWLVALLT